MYIWEDNTFGRYYLVADVEDLEQKYKDLLMVMEEQYIKRPDPEVARKAVDELISAATCFEAAHNNPLFEDYKEESIADLQRTKAAVLRLMGVA